MADTSFSVSADVSGAIASLDRLSAKITDTTTGLGRAFESMSTWTAGLAASLAAAGTAAAAFADDVVDLAKANDVAVGQILAFQSALQANGGKADNAGQAFQRLANSIQEANAGNLKTLNNFNKLGVSLQDLGTKSQTEIQDKLLKSLADIPDAAERNAMSMQFFGKSLIGVDIKKFAEDQAASRAEMEKYAPSLNSAADAFDNMESIVKKLKIAFLEVFKPVFDYIKDLKPKVDDLKQAFILLATALAMVGSAAVIAGLAKVYELVRAIGIVATRNPLIAIATALIAVGAGVATYMGLTEQAAKNAEEAAEATEKQAEAVQQTTRDQEGLNEAIKKEQQALAQIGQTLEKNWAQSKKRLDLELQSLNLNAEQKKRAEAIAQIDREASDAKLSLTQKFNQLDADGKARQLAFYEEELKNIDENAKRQKDATEQQISRIERLKQVFKDYSAIANVANDANIEYFNTYAKYINNNAGIYEKIDAEAKLMAITKTRSLLLGSLGDLAEADRAAATAAIGDITTRTDLLGKSYDEINQAIREGIQLQVVNGNIGQESANRIIETLNRQAMTTKNSAINMANLNANITRQSRTFADGWRNAFKEYADAASDAAAYAKNMFSKTMQGMEDLIVNFVKTGKFEWKSFVASMAEELLRSQVKQLLANLFSPQTALGGGLSGLLGIFAPSGVSAASGSIGASPATAMWVRMADGGGGFSNLFDNNGFVGPSFNNPMTPGGGFGGGLNQGGGMFGGISNVFGGITNTVGSVFSGIGNAVSSVWDSVTGLFDGFFANGGQIGAGKFGIVGERGPEFVSGPATVTPMGSTNVTYNINAVDAMSFKQMIAQDPSFIHAVAMQGAKGIPGRY